MTEQEAWFACRGVWKANRDRLSGERSALIIGGHGIVIAVGEITKVVPHDDRVALEGTVLNEGHPVRDARIGRPDPVQNNSQNPVGYIPLPREALFRERPCGCGCATISIRDFLPGHDVRAMQERVRRLFAGSALEFIAWVDRMAAEHGVPILEIRNPAALAVDRRPLPSLDRYDALLRHTGPAADQA